MKKVRLMLVLLPMVYVAAACKDDDDDNMGRTLPETDRVFVTNAADGGMFEVKAGEMAVAKGDSTGTGMVMGSDTINIKSFGRMMITDHTKANNELKALADQKNTDVPATLTTAKQKMLDSLSAVSGAAFNTMYAKMMVSSHQETVSLFNNHATNGKDTDLRSWASEKLPTLRHHLEMAEMMYEEIK